jgi:hypothetical protein
MKTKGEPMDPKKKFTAETIRHLKQTLEQVAPYEATELSKQQTIRTLSPQIVALRGKGYSWTAIAAMLSDQGVPVSVAALRTYLRRVRLEAASEAPRTAAKRSRDVRAVLQQAAPTPPVDPSRSQGPDASPVSKPHPAATTPAPAAPAAVRHAPAAATRREQEPSRSTFVPRPDTEDL